MSGQKDITKMVAPHCTGDIVRSLVRVPGSGSDKVTGPVCLDLSSVSSFAAFVPVPSTLPPALSTTRMMTPNNNTNKLIYQKGITAGRKTATMQAPSTSSMDQQSHSSTSDVIQAPSTPSRRGSVKRKTDVTMEETPPTKDCIRMRKYRERKNAEVEDMKKRIVELENENSSLRLSGKQTASPAACQPRIIHKETSEEIPPPSQLNEQERLKRLEQEQRERMLQRWHFPQQQFTLKVDGQGIPTKFTPIEQFIPDLDEQDRLRRHEQEQRELERLRRLEQEQRQREILQFIQELDEQEILQRCRPFRQQFIQGLNEQEYRLLQRQLIKELSEEILQKRRPFQQNMEQWSDEQEFRHQRQLLIKKLDEQRRGRPSTFLRSYGDPQQEVTSFTAYEEALQRANLSRQKQELQQQQQLKSKAGSSKSLTLPAVQPGDKTYIIPQGVLGTQQEALLAANLPPEQQQIGSIEGSSKSSNQLVYIVQLPGNTSPAILEQEPIHVLNAQQTSQGSPLSAQPQQQILPFTITADPTQSLPQTTNNEQEPLLGANLSPEQQQIRSTEGSSQSSTQPEYMVQLQDNASQAILDQDTIRVLNAQQETSQGSHLSVPVPQQHILSLAITADQTQSLPQTMNNEQEPLLEANLSSEQQQIRSTECSSQSSTQPVYIVQLQDNASQAIMDQDTIRVLNAQQTLQGPSLSAPVPQQQILPLAITADQTQSLPQTMNNEQELLPGANLSPEQQQIRSTEGSSQSSTQPAYLVQLEDNASPIILDQETIRVLTGQITSHVENAEGTDSRRSGSSAPTNDAFNSSPPERDQEPKNSSDVSQEGSEDSSDFENILKSLYYTLPEQLRPHARSYIFTSLQKLHLSSEK